MPCFFKRECHGKLKFGASCYTRPEPRITPLEAMTLKTSSFQFGSNIYGEILTWSSAWWPHLCIGLGQEVGGRYNAMIPYTACQSCTINQPALQSLRKFQGPRQLEPYIRMTFESTKYVPTGLVKSADSSYSQCKNTDFPCGFCIFWHTKPNNCRSISLIRPHPSQARQRKRVPLRDGSVLRRTKHFRRVSLTFRGWSGGETLVQEISPRPNQSRFGENFLDVGVDILNHANTWGQ